MSSFRKWLLVGITVLLIAGSLVQTAGSRGASAQVGPDVTLTPGEGEHKRITTITVQYTLYHWWMLRWSNNLRVCALHTDHEGLPNLADVEGQCDKIIFDEWRTTQPCDLAQVNSTTECKGFYLQQFGSEPAEKQVTIELPLPEVTISIDNCNPEPGDTRCTTLPDLLLTGIEPLPNEIIVDIQGQINGEPFHCMGGECRIPMQPTGLEGIDLEFWANSSYGDATPHYTAKVRLVPWGGFMDPEKQSQDPIRYYIDVISSQWKGPPIASCSETWQSFPGIGGPPDWLTTPADPSQLDTDVPYYYLAGALITYGVVDASGCLDGGLQAPNIASPCGVETAKPELGVWQNRFDEEILKASAETGLPAKLLKNIFSRESQIWPGIFRTYKETGLGQLTDNGADTILLWNPDFFHQFCPFVLHQSYCDLGYGNLTRMHPELLPMLRGALVRKVDASCPDCPASIDLSEANYSVHVFAQGMLANCEQVGRIITNETGLMPGQVASYEDLWRFVLVNYNAGPGCLSSAFIQSYSGTPPVTWEQVANNLDPVCEAAVGYVEDISQMLKPSPTPTQWLPFGEQPPTPVLPRVLYTATVTPTTQPTVHIPGQPPVFGPTSTPTEGPTPTITATGPTPTATDTPSGSYPPPEATPTFLPYVPP